MQFLITNTIPYAVLAARGDAVVCYHILSFHDPALLPTTFVYFIFWLLLAYEKHYLWDAVGYFRMKNNMTSLARNVAIYLSVLVQMKPLSTLSVGMSYSSVHRLLLLNSFRCSFGSDIMAHQFILHLCDPLLCLSASLVRSFKCYFSTKIAFPTCGRLPRWNRLTFFENMLILSTFE